MEKARDIERAFSNVPVDPVTGRKPGLSEERRRMRQVVFYADRAPIWEQEREEMLHEEKSRNHATSMFARRVFHLTKVGDEWGPSIPEERRCWQVQRLLAFPKCMLGLSTWEQLLKLEHQCTEAYRAYCNGLSANFPASQVKLKHGTFAKHVAALGWVRLAGQSKHSETQSTSTENYPHAFPIKESRSLPERCDLRLQALS